MISYNRNRERLSGIALTRRFVAGVTVLGLFGWIGARSIRPPEATLEAEAAILTILPHRESASHIGRLALASWPQMRDRMSLLSTVLEDLQLDITEVAQVTANELGNRLSQRIQMDFSVGRTVSLDGWLLSLAEVRVCALAALNP
jgi:hypothetical protein